MVTDPRHYLDNARGISIIIAWLVLDCIHSCVVDIQQLAKVFDPALRTETGQDSPRYRGLGILAGTG